MDECVFSFEQFNECTEFLNATDRSIELFPDDDFTDDIFDQLTGTIDASLIRRSDKDCSVLIDVDLNACLINDTVDDFTTRSDDITDFIWIDFKCDDFRRVLRQFDTRFSNDRLHMLKNMQTTKTCLFKCFFKNLTRDSANFHIHLQSCDTFVSSSDFKVHISEMIFHPLDICQDRVIFAFHDQAHRDTSDRCF